MRDTRKVERDSLLSGKQKFPPVPSLPHTHTHRPDAPPPDSAVTVRSRVGRCNPLPLPAIFTAKSCYPMERTCARTHVTSSARLKGRRRGASPRDTSSSPAACHVLLVALVFLFSSLFPPLRLSPPHSCFPSLFRAYRFRLLGDSSRLGKG